MKSSQMSKLSAEQRSATELKALLRKPNLIDIWRVKHLTERKYICLAPVKQQCTDMIIVVISKFLGPSCYRKKS